MHLAHGAAVEFPLNLTGKGVGLIRFELLTIGPPGAPLSPLHHDYLSGVKIKITYSIESTRKVF